MHDGAPSGCPVGFLAARCDASGANLPHLLRRGPLLPLDDVELNGVTLSERLEAFPLDRAEVHETVLLAVVRGDETEPLRVVEPLHLAGRTHALLLRCLVGADGADSDKCVTCGTPIPPALGSDPNKRPGRMSPGSVYSGIAGAEYINFRRFGNTRPPRLQRSDAGARSGLRRRRDRGVASHVLDEHLRAEPVRFLHVFVVMTLARVANLPELFVAELP